MADLGRLPPPAGAVIELPEASTVWKVTNVTKGALAAAALLLGGAVLSAPAAFAQDLELPFLCQDRQTAALVVTVGATDANYALDAGTAQPIRMEIVDDGIGGMTANQTANLFYGNWRDNTHFVTPCHGWYRIDWSVTPIPGTPADMIAATEFRFGNEVVATAQSAGASTSSGFAILRVDPDSEFSIWLKAPAGGGTVSLANARFMITWIPWIDRD